MKKNENIVFLGGDDRAAYAAQYLCQKGYEVGYCACESKAFSAAVKIEKLEDALRFANVVVLPIPITRDQLTLAYSNGILLDQIVSGACAEKSMVFLGGLIPSDFKSKLEQYAHQVVDYSLDEEYLQSSAKLTALGFWDLLDEFEFPPLNEKRVVVCGLGRIGSRLACDLCRRNAQVTVLSGKSKQNALAFPDNVSFCCYQEASKALCECDAVINTAPAHVIDIQALERIPQNAQFYELASAPFGIDEKGAAFLGQRYVKAPGLPGKYYPKESGELIAKAVLKNVCRQSG